MAQHPLLSALDSPLCSLLLLYIVLALLTLSASPLMPRSLSTVFLGLEAVWLTVAIVKSIRVKRKVDRLGARAPAATGWLPFSTDFLVQLIWHFLNDQELDFSQQIFRRFGHPDRPWTIEATTSGRVILTADEDNIKALLTRVDDFGKGPKFYEMHKEFLGQGIIATDGDHWRASRSLLRPHFTKGRLEDLQSIARSTDILLPLLAGPNPIVIDDIFSRLTIDIITDFMFGRSIDSLTDPKAEFMQAFDDVQRTQGLIERTGSFGRFVPKRKFRKGLSVLNRIMAGYIDEAISKDDKTRSNAGDADSRFNFLDASIEHSRNRTVLRDQLITILLAGRDTTATTLTWLFYELSRNPSIVDKLRDEIGHTIGLDPSHSPSRAELKNLQFLQHTINETLRLYPPIPTNARFALKDTVLPRGGGADGTEPVAVLEGTPVVYSTMVLQRRPDLYNPAAKSSDQTHHLAFEPERWQSWTPKPWTYIPFNGGPRICIGQQFALTEVAYVAVKILQTFHGVELSSATHEVRFRTGFALKPAEKIQLRFVNAGGGKQD